MSSDNKLDKTGLAYLWSKMTAYVQEIVGYVPELFIQIGNTPLGTTAATISGAIREIADRVGNTVMGTTATTVTGAVKELVDKIGNAEMGTEAVTIMGAIAEHEQDISSLKSDLDDVSFARKSLAENTDTSFSIPDGYRGLLVISDSTANRNGLYHIFATGTGATGYRAIISSDVLTINTSTANKLVVKPSSGNPVATFIEIVGNVSW